MKKVCLPAVFLLAISSICFSETIHVPGDQPTIESAVWSANEGDVVIVAPGTYKENIVFQGKDIVVKSSDGPEVTVIDGGNPIPNYDGSVAKFDSGESAACVLEGFTLTNGKGTKHDTWHEYRGGGVYCDGASPTLRNLIITGNRADHGGGVYCGYKSNPTLIDVLITDNEADDYDGEGGGIYCNNQLTQVSNLEISGNTAVNGGGISCYHSPVTISGCTITGNSAENGGGIWVKYGSPTIINNTISDNTAIKGAGIYSYYYESSWDYGLCPLRIKNNLITRNAADQDGGGIWLDCDDGTSVSGNIITDNSADSEGGGIFWEASSPFVRNNMLLGNTSGFRGGGVFCRDTSSDLTNNLIAGNTSIHGAGIYGCLAKHIGLSGCTIADNTAADTGGGLTLHTVDGTEIKNTIFWGNSAPVGQEIADHVNFHECVILITYSDICGGQNSVEVNPGCAVQWGDGVIDADPLFVDPTQSEYYLKQVSTHPGEHSPCVDAGESDSSYGGVTRNDSVRDVSPVDMGFHHPPDDPIIIKVPNDHSTLRDAIDATWDGDLVIVSPGTYVENIDFQGKAIYVRSSDGPESTVIDGGMPANPKEGSVVLINKGERADSILEGFTLKNGTGTTLDYIFDGNTYYGGGICCANCKPHLKNNVISANSSDYGGGLYCFKADPMIHDNVFEWNSVEYTGGGIYSYDSSPVLTSNIIKSNIASVGNGGGIYCTLESEPSILNNIITKNWAAMGGGIYIDGECDAIVTDNEISENSALQQGGGLFINNSRPEIMYNSISNNQAQFGGGVAYWTCNSFLTQFNEIVQNTASQKGGGIHFVDSYATKFRHNIIAGNSAYSGGGLCLSDSDIESAYCTIHGNTAISGGGLYIVNGSKPEFINMILSKNTAEEAAQIEIRGGFKTSKLTISYSDVEGGQATVLVDPDCALVVGNGVIDADPLFVDPEILDFHLTYPSPCRGAGQNLVGWPPAEDFEGDPRIWEDLADMGVDEFHPHLYCTGDFSPHGTIEGKFVGVPGTTQVGLFIGSGILETPLQHTWGEFHLKSPWLFVPLVSIPANGVLEIQTTIPGYPVGPYDIPMQALIGDVLTNLFVIEVR